jgi:hypothetical protein
VLLFNLKFAEATLTCTRFEPRPLISLSENIASDPISLSPYELQSFAFVMQPGTRVICDTTGDNGDADLYLRWDAAPDIDLFLYDCVSGGSGSVESCAVENPGFATVLWATIVPYSSFTDVTITCRSTSAVSAIALTAASASDRLSLPTGLSQTFVLDVGSVSSTVVCETLCDNGDADMYVRVDAEPSISSGLYDCDSAGSASIEECIVSDLEEATLLFVTVTAFFSFEDLTLTCSSITDTVKARPVLDLVDGVPSESFSLHTNQVQELTLQIDPSTDALCTTSGNNGDADLFVRWDTAPNIGQLLFDCVSNDALSNESCRVLNPGNATAIWASVFTFSNFDDLSVTCTSTQLAARVPVPTGETSGATSLSFVLTLVLAGSLLPLWWFMGQFG